MHITHLQILNVKLLRNFELAFGSPEEPRLWTVLIGQNGLCKTTILRSIAMAAVGYLRANQLADVPSLLDRRSDADLRFSAILGFSPSDHARREYPGLEWAHGDPTPPAITSGLSLVRGGSSIQGASAFVAANKDNQPTAQLSDPSTPSPVDVAADRNLPHWFVAGYGTSRILPDPLESRTPHVPSRDRLNSLFDKGPILGTGFVNILDHPEAFAETLNQALVEGGLLPDAIGMTLETRSGGNGASVNDRHRLSMQAGHGRFEVPTTWLSQGYQSTIAWIADIIGWFFFERKEPVALDAMEGLVLIDEIDLHLHPQWQVELVPALKKVFPRLQFIVTTHSPMVLPGLRQEEVKILRQDDEGNVYAEDAPDTPALMTGSQIYQDFFGIDRLYPAQLGADLQRYGFLVGMAHRTDEEEGEVYALRDRLREAGVDPGWEITPREIEA